VSVGQHNIFLFFLYALAQEFPAICFDALLSILVAFISENT